MKTHYDVAIIGAGPAGSIAAMKLLKEGKSVLVLEKMIFPRFVIGESMLPHIMDYLKDLDLLDVMETQKYQVKDGVSFYDGEKKCQFLFNNQVNKDYWKYTWQVKRADFDSVLIQEAQKRGADVLFEAAVTAVETTEKKQTVHFEHPTMGNQTVTSDFLLDASGYGRVLPRLKDLEAPSSALPRGAVFTHIKDINRTTDAGKNILIHVFRDNTAWFWSIPFADGSCSVGIVSDVDYIKDCAADDAKEFKRLLNELPELEGRFSNVELLFPPKHILSYSISVKQLYGEGYALCGNATEFLDPTFSSGVLFAVVSGYKAAEMVAKQLNGEKVDWESDYSNYMKQGINVFRTYVDGWYDGRLGTIFFAKERNEEIMKQICSVLAGYVWDDSNPFVKKHDKVVTSLAKVIQINEGKQVTYS
ncbi:MAG: tryptophan 7-halogenase [Crocinitomicaceae bacterium]|nr:tryptophan 7-halogenase [Crocinitomicaceae bacterium]